MHNQNSKNMKKLLYTLLAMATFASCDKDPKPEVKKPLDPFAQILVHVKPSLATRADSKAMTPREMLEKAHYFQMWTFEAKDHPVTRSIGDNEKDFEKLAFLWWGDDVVRADTIVTYWRDARDLLIMTGLGDTIGYIPQSVRNEAFDRILNAEKEKDYDLIYKIFNEAFVGIPCTAEEYKVLKAEGKN